MKKKIAVVIIFIIILVFPMVTWPIASQFDLPTVDENREKAKFPQFGNDVFAQFDAYFADRAPYRDVMIRLYKEVELKLKLLYEKTFPVVINNVLLGRDDWLFYTGDNSIDYYRGINLPTEDELKAYVARAEKVNDYFKAQGKEFVIFVAPNKEQMYPEHMPRGISVVNEVRRMDVIYRYFKEHSNVTVLFPKAELLAAKSENEIYYQQDTHWNEFGGWIGAQALFKALNLPVGEATVTEIPYSGGDLASMAALTPASYTAYHVDYRSDVSIEYLVRSDYEYTIKSSNKNGKRLLLLGDSFRNAMREIIAKEYESSIINHRETFNHEKTLVEEFEAATTVIFQSVERYEPTIFSEYGVLQRFINIYGL